MSSPSSEVSQMPSHGPYLPQIALLGGLPSKNVDDPIVAVFMFLFACAAAAHMTILQVNLRRGRKFFMSGMLFGFCMARIATCTMRLVWASHPTNVRVGIAAQIFVAAGVLLLFVINLIFTQRVLRATYPRWAWKKWFSLAYKAYYASIVLMLIALIICTVQTFYTLSPNTRRIDRDVQLVGATYFAISAFLPIPILLLRAIFPSSKHVEKFGEGRFRHKIYILIFTATILTLGAAFRTGASYLPPRPKNDPAWYQSKACFYIFNFTVEIITVVLYAVVRVDKRFIVPNASHAPGDYSGHVEKSIVGQSNRAEEEVFYDMESSPEFDGVGGKAEPSPGLDSVFSGTTVGGAQPFSLPSSKWIQSPTNNIFGGDNSSSTPLKELGEAHLWPHKDTNEALHDGLHETRTPSPLKASKEQ